MREKERRTDEDDGVVDELPEGSLHEHPQVHVRKRLQRGRISVY